MAQEGDQPAVQMQIGTVSARAFAVAAHIADGRTERLATIGGDQVATDG